MGDLKLTENEVFSPIYGLKLNILGRALYFGLLKPLKEGSPGMVDFDGSEVMKNRKWLVGFYHTHPTFSAMFSSIDKATMSGWANSTGKDLACLIECPRNKELLGWYYCKQAEGFILGWCTLLFNRRLVIGFA